MPSTSRSLLRFSFLLLLATVFVQGFLPVKQVTDSAAFKGQRVENLAVRSNGEILVTVSSPVAAVYQVSPSNAYPPIRVASFPKSKGAFGIVELGSNKFYVATSSSTTKNVVAKSSHLFEIDMSAFKASQGKPLPSTSIRRVADLPNARFPNGVTAATSPSSSVILVADSRVGCVWRVDSKSGDVTRINEATGSFESLDGTSLGINGVKVVKILGQRFLFYTNTATSSVYKVLIKPLGALNGPVMRISSSDAVTYDDFDVTSDGDVYVVSPGGGLYNYASGSGPDDGGDPAPLASLVDTSTGALRTPTSVRFGRGSGQKFLYVTTNTKSGDGGVVSVDVSIRLVRRFNCG